MDERPALQGSCALVTGAGGGIGGGVARSLAAAGAALVLSDIDEERGIRICEEVVASGGRATFHRLDVTDADAWLPVVEQGTEEHGPIATLVNVAGLKASTIPGDKALLDLDLATWDRMLDVNLRGPMLGARSVLPGMLAAGQGSIISISTVGSIHASADHGTAYSSSKAGLNGLTRAIAVSYGRHGVRCNAIAPGPIIVDDRSAAQQQYERATAGLIARSGRPADVGAAAVFLASPASAFCNGQVLVVDGGLTTHLPGLSSVSFATLPPNIAEAAGEAP